MKMPETIDVAMLAPCGMNCTVCYKHCLSKTPCKGCNSNEVAKPDHCGKCKIKSCITDRRYTHCFQCIDFPCKHIENFERRYERYNWSLIMNSYDAKDTGVPAFLEGERRYWTCSRCGGIISIHSAECSDCGAKLVDMRLGPNAQFGIIDNFDKQKDYSEFTEGLSFEDCLNKYQCISIPDEIINYWWEGLTSMKSYFHKFSRPETALARWGVTLIPPDSLDIFAEIIRNHTNERFSRLCETEISALLNLLNRAKKEDKFVIHYGV